jgi:radical SAM protein
MVRDAQTNGWFPRKMSRADLADSPLLVFYEVTQACDLACQHCRACAETESHPGELSTEESLRLIDQLTEFPSPPMLVLTGGDPLKRADIFQLIEHAARRGLDVSITPSATPLVTPQAIRRLRDAGISRLAISIDGADAQAHDATRGVVGSFERSLRILDDARQQGIPTQINTTITPTNFEQIHLMAELFGQQRIAMWSGLFLVPVGRAKNAPRLSADQYEQVFERLWHQSQRQPYAIKTTEAPQYRRFVIKNQMPKKNQHGDKSPLTYMPLGVNDGKGVMFVSHVGMIHPSGFMPILCGMYPQEHVVTVYQDSPVFRGLRDAERLEGKCEVCEFRSICGGSRARAYAVTDNPFAQEPDCSYIPEAVTRALSASL